MNYFNLHSVVVSVSMYYYVSNYTCVLKYSITVIVLHFIRFYVLHAISSHGTRDFGPCGSIMNWVVM